MQLIALGEISFSKRVCPKRLVCFTIAVYAKVRQQLSWAAADGL